MKRPASEVLNKESPKVLKLYNHDLCNNHDLFHRHWHEDEDDSSASSLTASPTTPMTPPPASPPMWARRTGPTVTTGEVAVKKELSEELPVTTGEVTIKKEPSEELPAQTPPISPTSPTPPTTATTAAPTTTFCCISDIRLGLCPCHFHGRSPSGCLGRHSSGGECYGLKSHGEKIPTPAGADASWQLNIPIGNFQMLVINMMVILIKMRKHSVC